MSFRIINQSSENDPQGQSHRPSENSGKGTVRFSRSGEPASFDVDEKYIPRPTPKREPRRFDADSLFDDIDERPHSRTHIRINSDTDYETKRDSTIQPPQWSQPPQPPRPMRPPQPPRQRARTSRPESTGTDSFAHKQSETFQRPARAPRRERRPFVSSEEDYAPVSQPTSGRITEQNSGGAFVTSQSVESLDNIAPASRPADKSQKKKTARKISSRKKAEPKKREPQKSSRFVGDTPQPQPQPEKQDKRKARAEKTARKADERYKRRKKTGNSDKEKREFLFSAEKRRKIQLIVGSLLVAALVIVGICALLYFKLPIEKIDITGLDVSGYSAETMQSDCFVREGDSIIFISKKNVNAYVTEKYPYISSVKLRRNLREKTVILEMIETEDRFKVKMGDSVVWLNEDYKILSTEDKNIKKGQVELSGFDPQPASEKADYTTSFEPGNTITFTDSNKDLFVLANKIYNITADIGMNIKKIEFSRSDVIISQDNHITIYAYKTTNFEKKLADVSTIISERKINTDFYFDIRPINEFFYDYGKAPY